MAKVTPKHLIQSEAGKQTVKKKDHPKLSNRRDAGPVSGSEEDRHAENGHGDHVSK